jgi:hypothetical protein
VVCVALEEAQGLPAAPSAPPEPAPPEPEREVAPVPVPEPAPSPVHAAPQHPPPTADGAVVRAGVGGFVLGIVVTIVLYVGTLWIAGPEDADSATSEVEAAADERPKAKAGKAKAGKAKAGKAKTP